jgi:hypothetical protein
MLIPARRLMEMEGRQSEYIVRNPPRVKLIIALILLCLVFSLLTSRSLDDEITGISIFMIVLSFGYVVILCWAIYLALKKPAGLILRDEGTIELNGTTLKAEQIKAIMFKDEGGDTVIGIKPIGNRIVPIRLCFRFAKGARDGEAVLTSWAERNEVKVLRKFFFRWM